jgi:hypothetical protein
MNEKHSSKPPCKSVSKQPSTVSSNQQNSAPIRAPAVDSDLWMQKVNRDDGIMTRGIRIYPSLLRLILMQLESLTEIWKSSNIGDVDEDDMYFPTVQKLIAG